MFKILLIATLVSGSGGSTSVSISIADGSWRQEAECNVAAKALEESKIQHSKKLPNGKLTLTATCYKVDTVN